MNSTATRNLQKLYLYVYQAFAMHVSRYGAGIEHLRQHFFQELLPVSVSYQAVMCIPWRAHVDWKYLRYADVILFDIILLQ